MTDIANQENYHMELSLIFDIAKTVLIKVISDLIADKIKEVRKAEIKKEVAAILQEEPLVKQQDLKLLLREVIDEIEILSRRDADLKVSNDYTIKLAKPVRKLRLPLVEKDINQELYERLQRLDEIIDQRRKEKEVELPKKDEELPIQWKYVHKQQETNRWEQEIMDMEDRIRRRRTGEVLQDE